MWKMLNAELIYFFPYLMKNAFVSPDRGITQTSGDFSFFFFFNQVRFWRDGVINMLTLEARCKVSASKMLSCLHCVIFSLVRLNWFNAFSTDRKNEIWHWIQQLCDMTHLQCVSLSLSVLDSSMLRDSFSLVTWIATNFILWQYLCKHNQIF